jgi:hypothetical protein
MSFVEIPPARIFTDSQCRALLAVPVADGFPHPQSAAFADGAAAVLGRKGERRLQVAGLREQGRRLSTQTGDP